MRRLGFAIAWLLASQLATALPGQETARLPGISKRIPWTTSRVVGSPDPPSPYVTELAFPSLLLKDAVALSNAPGSDRLFVADRNGKIFSFPNDPQVATADLVLDVKDPVGPVPVGTEATYTISIQNRGTETADGVEAVVYFSRGIEPVSADGAHHKLGPGQVVFERIPSLGVGKSIQLQIRAKAETAGNHVFRAEVYCNASGIRLVSEEMTHFYGGRSRPQQAATDPADSAHDVLRTAERP